MIFRVLLLSAILGISGCSTGNAGAKVGVILGIEKTSAGLELSIRNESGGPVELMLPMVITIDGGVSGQI